MIFLPNGCSCSNLKVYPENWKTINNCNENWYIFYRFYDPIRGKKLKIVKGMNRFKNVTDRIKVTERIFDSELSKLKRGYNPFLKERYKNDAHLIDEDTPIIEALWIVLEKIKNRIHNNTYLDIKSSLKYISIAAKDLSRLNLTIEDFRKRDLKEILDFATSKKTAQTFNRYKKNIGILLSEIVELDLLEINYANILKKRKTIRKIRQVLTEKERELINEFTGKHYPKFNRFIHIFFHSGARLTELTRVKVKDVDLENQVFLITVLKGSSPFQALKPIKNIALPYWIELLKETKNEEDYIFSNNLSPGKEEIRPEQFTRRWKRHVKEKLGIKKDLYSLKHLNSDEIAKNQGIEAAANLNSHTSIRTTLIYAIGEKERELENLKKINNAF